MGVFFLEVGVSVPADLGLSWSLPLPLLPEDRIEVGPVESDEQSSSSSARLSNSSKDDSLAIVLSSSESCLIEQGE